MRFLVQFSPYHGFERVNGLVVTIFHPLVRIYQKRKITLKSENCKKMSVSSSAIARGCLSLSDY
jgi:hypothetical protein